MFSTLVPSCGFRRMFGRSSRCWPTSVFCGCAFTPEVRGKSIAPCPLPATQLFLSTRYTPRHKKTMSSTTSSSPSSRVRRDVVTGMNILRRMFGHSSWWPTSNCDRAVRSNPRCYKSVLRRIFGHSSCWPNSNCDRAVMHTSETRHPLPTYALVKLVRHTTINYWPNSTVCITFPLLPRPLVLRRGSSRW